MQPLLAARLLFLLLFRRASLLTLSEILCSQSTTNRAAGKTHKRSCGARELPINVQLRKARELFCVFG